MSKKPPGTKKSGDIKGYLVNTRSKSLRAGANMDIPNKPDSVPQPTNFEEMFDKLSDKLDRKFDENNAQRDLKFEENNVQLIARVDQKFDECSNKWDANIDLKFLEVQSKLGRVQEEITLIEGKLNGVVQTQGIHKLRQDEQDIKLNAMEIKYLKLEQIVNELTKKEETFDESLAYVNKDVETLKRKAEYQKHDRERLSDVEKRCSDSDFKDEIKEQHSRKMNLWVYGIEQTNMKDEDAWSKVCEFATKVLKIEAKDLDEEQIKNVHRVGDKKDKNRPIIVAFLRAKDRQRFLRASSKLFDYNKEHKTKFGVKTDLAPMARARRRSFQEAAHRWRTETGKILRVCNNDMGKIWMESKTSPSARWYTLGYIDPKWFQPMVDQLRGPGTTTQPEIEPLAGPAVGPLVGPVAGPAVAPGVEPVPEDEPVVPETESETDPKLDEPEVEPVAAPMVDPVVDQEAVEPEVESESEQESSDSEEEPEDETVKQSN